ncbi:hypothetical protein [Kitasatospora cheerisanensis]|uniref:DUF3168 domain-containing protein n=1 Tax=Kitasatospora cheerisanensis KCTC 2395 TaxID=1348663 RepID=A0A066YPJ6_9ACTN|nr:hypothetical protein [Kitasatospora cheerisanensis]KDN83473.1 hypothetical protein KCH_49550 [Kitasatospora cheerisanensis KCTC 2395]
MTALPPDVDRLVRGALTAELGPAVTVMTLMPDTWAQIVAAGPLVIARSLPGAAAIDPRGVITAVIDLQALAADRDLAAETGRRAWRALYDACVRQWADQDAGGWLSHFSSGTLPAELRAGSPPPDAQSFRFQSTVRLTARPTPTP